MKYIVAVAVNSVILLGFVFLAVAVGWKNGGGYIVQAALWYIVFVVWNAITKNWDGIVARFRNHTSGSKTPIFSTKAKYTVISGVLLIGGLATFGVIVKGSSDTVSRRSGQRINNRNSITQPWMEPSNPTKLEWLALKKQASEGDTEFGENGLTINFYLGRDSISQGTVYCDLEWLSGTSAEMVSLVEDGIRRRFELTKGVHPWAKLTLIKTAHNVPRVNTESTRW